MGLAEQLEEVQQELRTQITEAFNAAYSIAEGAGVTPQWEAICQKYGVALLSDQERQQVRAAQRPTRGAAVMEFQAVAVAIVKGMRRRLKKMDTWDAGSRLDGLHTRLIYMCDRTDKELVDAYRNAVLPKAGGMFANVFTHHDPNAKKPASGPMASTLSCKNCGAPRLKTGEIECAYCGLSMV